MRPYPIAKICHHHMMRGRLAISLAIVMAVLSFSAIAPPVFAQKSQQVPGYSLAFVDADVKRVADAVMGEMLNVPYNVDDDVSGKITLRTANPVPKTELIALLERALLPLKAVVLTDGAGYRIVLRKNAARNLVLPSPSLQQSPLPSFTNPQNNIQPAGNSVAMHEFAPSAPGFASEAITLHYASAANLADMISDFLGEGIAEDAKDGKNTIIISGSGQERDAAKKLIQRFDVDNLANMAYEIYRLDNVDPLTLVNELEAIFQPPYDILGSRIRLIPLPRLRSVMGIAANHGDLARIAPWIARLDTGASGKRKLYSYAVQNGRARDIARSLQAVLGQGNGQNLEPERVSETRAEPRQAFAQMDDFGGGNGRDNGQGNSREINRAETPMDNVDMASDNAGPAYCPQYSK